MIKVYTEWCSDLQKVWVRSQVDAEAFPQSYIEWVEPWSRARVERGNLLVLVYDGPAGVGIAAFRRRRKLGFQVLESIPFHFGDRFDFIVYGPQKKEIYKALFSFLQSYKSWSYVHLRNVFEKSELNNFIQLVDCKRHKINEQIVAELHASNLDDYLMSLKGKVRTEFRRRLRKLSSMGDLKFHVSDDPQDYLEWEGAMIQMERNRAAAAGRKVNGSEVYAYRKEALTGLCAYNIPLFMILTLDSEIIAYRIGLLSSGVYNDFKLSVAPSYARLGLGSIINAKLIEYLLGNNVRYLNHGMGNYSYKRDWSERYELVSSHDFHMWKSASGGYIYWKWLTEWRELLKQIRQKWTDLRKS